MSPFRPKRGRLEGDRAGDERASDTLSNSAGRNGQGSFTWAASDWTPSEKTQRQVAVPLRTPPQRAPTKWDGRQRSPCLTHLMEERSLRGGQPNIQHVAVRHAEHLEGCPFKAVHIFTVLAGDCEDSVGEALAGGVHLCGVTLEVVRDLG